MAEFSSDFKIRNLEKERQKQIQEYQETITKLKEESQKGVIDIQQKFDKHKNVREEVFKQQTIGLVTLEDFKKKRLEVEQADDPTKLNKEAIKKRKSKVESNKLSFDFGEEEEEEEEDETLTKKKKSLGKNPDVETSFLPDKEREESEKLIRIELAKEWKSTQEKIKNETIEIQYSYHDGKDQIRYVSVKKGISIQAFLELCKPEFKELKGVSTNDLLFINKEFIIPQHHTLYDLLLLNDTVKTGAQKLFDFREKTGSALDKSPTTKIVERRWLDKNSTAHPYSQWKMFESSLYTSDVL